MMDKILIEKYFTGKITAEESLEFKKRYISDPEFKQEVDFYKNVKRLLGLSMMKILRLPCSALNLNSLEEGR